MLLNFFDYVVFGKNLLPAWYREPEQKSGLAFFVALKRPRNVTGGGVE